jgi:hypothetical protein
MYILKLILPFGGEMGKFFKVLALVFVGLTLALGGADDAFAKKKKKKPSLKKMKYVGAAKCNGSCHDPYYQAWVKSPHGGTFNLLKAGVRKEAKERAKLDPEKDYTADPHCLRCHTTGYKQKGGFKPAGTKNKKGKDKSTKIDPEEPSLEQVGCEMCHSVAGGSEMRLVMKNSKGKFKKAETEKFGQRWDYANVCTRCHTHKNTPFQPTLHDKYKFNFEERKKKVHQTEKYWSEDNEDQRLEHIKKRTKQTAKSEETPLIIEDWKIKKGKLKFKKGTKPFSKKKKKFNYKG